MTKRLDHGEKMCVNGCENSFPGLSAAASVYGESTCILKIKGDEHVLGFVSRAGVLVALSKLCKRLV